MLDCLKTVFRNEHKHVPELVGDAEKRADYSKIDLLQETKRLREYIRQETGGLDELSGNDRKLHMAYLRAREKTLTEIMPEAFAVVQEGIRRFHENSQSYDVQGQPFTWEIARAYDEQLMAASVLSGHNVAEQATGEGKTLTAVFAAYLNALDGKGVHIVTPNEYLAERDRQTMGPLLESLGIGVGLVKNEIDSSWKTPEYMKDVVYGSNEQFAFDFLRNNRINSKDGKFRAPALMAIVDEADNILIDKGRIPHKISQPNEESAENYEALNHLLTDDDGKLILTEAKKVSEEIDGPGDYTVNRRKGTISLTDEGISRLEQLLGTLPKYEAIVEREKQELRKELGEKEASALGEFAFPFYHEIRNIVSAHALFNKDHHYIVDDEYIENETGEKILKKRDIRIINEHTGRIDPDSRWSFGLHQAIEAKENAKINPEGTSSEEISLQNYFLSQYAKLSGMTGTGMTDEREFGEIYGLSVISIPTHKPCVRKDLDYKLYQTTAKAVDGALEELIENHEKGRPVLVVTTSDEMSVRVHDAITRLGLQAELLNAGTTYKDKLREAAVIAKAGKKGSIVVATKIAGRGTDIKLDDETRNIGGLHILGIGLQEEERIERQLNGRAGRQGDAGSSVYHVSIDDPTVDRFMQPVFMRMISSLLKDDAVQSRTVSNVLHGIQGKVRDHHFGDRKSVVKSDTIRNYFMNVFRNLKNNLIEDEDPMKCLIEPLAVSHSINLEQELELKNGACTFEALKVHADLLGIPFDGIETAKEAKREIMMNLKKNAADKENAVEKKFKELWNKLEEPMQKTIISDSISEVNDAVIPIYLQTSEMLEHGMYVGDYQLELGKANDRAVKQLLGKLALRTLIKMHGMNALQNSMAETSDVLPEENAGNVLPEEKVS